MLAAGDSGKVQKGKDILMWAVIGLVIVFTSVALVAFVIEGITGAKLESTSQIQNQEIKNS